jgi:hypothetical protein
MEMRRLNIQLTDVATLLHELLAHIGYISEFIVHGIGPIPTQQNKMPKLLETKSVAQWIISVMNSTRRQKTNAL